MEDYHANEAYGSSAINDYIKSPALAHWRKSHNTKSTAAMQIGTAFHELCQGTFEDHYEVGPDVDRRTKVWKEAVGQSDKRLITPVDFNILRLMHGKLLSNAYASELIQDAEYETTFRMPYKNISIQCRADALHRWSHIVDIKTTQDVDSFEKSVVHFGYFRQAALYRFIIAEACGKLLPFTFVVCEKQAPFRCIVFDLSNEYLELGWRQVEAAIEGICNNNWQDEQYACLDKPNWLGSANE